MWIYTGDTKSLSSSLALLVYWNRSSFDASSFHAVPSLFIVVHFLFHAWLEKPATDSRLGMDSHNHTRMRTHRGRDRRERERERAADLGAIDSGGSLEHGERCLALSQHSFFILVKGGQVLCVWEGRCCVLSVGVFRWYVFFILL